MAATDSGKARPLWRKPLLSALLGATLAMSPLLVGSAPTTDMSLLVAMSTVNDVRDSLDEKLALLTQARERSGQLAAGSAEARQLAQAMEIHFRNAKDIQDLALGFLGTSSARFPEYAKYWDNYRRRLLETWQKIRSIHDSPVARAAEAAAVETAPAQVAATPEATRQPVQTADQHDLMKQYREAYKKYTEGSPASLETARERFQDLLSREPAFHLARYWLARILLQQGKLAEAKQHAKTLVDDQPGLKMARNLLRDVEAAGRRDKDKGPAAMASQRGRTRITPFLSASRAGRSPDGPP